MHTIGMADKGKGYRTCNQWNHYYAIFLCIYADDLVEAVTEAETCSREVAIRIGDSGDKTTDLADKVESLAKMVKREQDEVERSVDAPSFFSLSFSFPLPPPLFLLPPPLFLLPPPLFLLPPPSSRLQAHLHKTTKLQIHETSLYHEKIQYKKTSK